MAYEYDAALMKAVYKRLGHDNYLNMKRMLQESLRRFDPPEDGEIHQETVDLCIGMLETAFEDPAFDMEKIKEIPEGYEEAAFSDSVEPGYLAWNRNEWVWQPFNHIGLTVDEARGMYLSPIRVAKPKEAGA